MQPNHQATMRRRTARATAAVASAALAAAAALAAPALAGTTPGEETISTSGSTALKNWFVAKTNTFTEIQPGTSLTLSVGNGNGNGTTTFNATGYQLYQLAPTSTTSTFDTGVAASVDAVRFEYHESGSVEGILEMANDQISNVNYVTQNVNRNPNGGNAVWVNYNQFGGVGKTNWSPTASPSPTSGSSIGGYTLGNFYNAPTGSDPVAVNSSFTYGSASNPTPLFNLQGVNQNGGQNAVQLAVSDVIPVQAFANNTTTSTSSTPWFNTPQSAGYGQGNTLLSNGSTGTAGSRQTFQSTTSLNMAATAINPRTGTAFGVGAWNTAGLGNLTSQTVAITATTFVANPGTGLTQVDRTDAQWLQTSSRLQNGATFNMSTRDVNSGTRNVAALETGIDPTYATGLNDNGNGNNPDGGTSQIEIGTGLRFSNKTAGGAQLRPTVEAARMAVGTLSINDASGQTSNSGANPLRVLAYSDSTDGSKAYVVPGYSTISNGTYTIFQNEQFVTVKAPDANYSTATPDIQGDNATHDVQQLINNTQNSVSNQAFYMSNGTSTAASPAAGLLTQGYITPQLMQVMKSQNGLNVAGTASAIVANPSYNASLASGSAFNSLVTSLTMDGGGTASNVTTGTGSFYGGSSAFGSGVNGSYGNVGGAQGQIKITSSNYLFGNFNQNGVRDYDAVVVEAQKAQAALASSGAGTSSVAGGSNGTVVSTGVSPLDSMSNFNGSAGATKGDLIVMGDYNGDGVFDGKDLYDMAVGASLTDANAKPTETTTNGVTTFTTGHINTTAANFGTAIASSVLNKNTALDYLQSNATATQKQEARAVLEGPAVPAGATQTGTDTENGAAQFTFDPTGTNAFNKSDVNSDGTVDMNDAVLVDKFAGQDYTNLNATLTATQQTPVTGATQLADLVLVKQTDTGTTINANDLAVENTALTGVGNTNWYGFNLPKTGTGTIILGRTGGTVRVYAGASFGVSAGLVQIAGTQDPFTDNSGASTNGNHVSLSLSTGGKVQFTQTGGTSTVAALSIDTAHSSTLDVGSTKLLVNFGSGADPTAAVRTYLASGYAGGHWNGSAGIVSAVAAASPGKLSVGYADGKDGVVAGLSAGNVEVLETYGGDADLNHVVDLNDLTLLAEHFGQTSGSTWDQGDFTYDSSIDLNDLTVLAENFGLGTTANTVAERATMFASDLGLVEQEYPSFGGAVSSSGINFVNAVPEPTSLTVLAIGGALLGTRRRRA